MQDCHGKISIQREESFHQQNGLKLKEETSTAPHLEYSFVYCWNFDTSKSSSQILGKFWSVVQVEGCRRSVVTDRVRNEEVLHGVFEDRNILHKIKW